MKDTLMQHAFGTNTLLNATRFSHNSIQGHHHSKFGVEYYADKSKLRWSMSVGCLVDPDSVAARYAAGSAHTRAILGTGVLLGDTNTLVISDAHLPYQHKDAFDFLEAIKHQYLIDDVLNVGDLYDHHRGSYHESEPDAYGEEEEYERARDAAHELQEIFPDMVITEGNHDAIPQRKLKSCGLPQSVLSDYNAMYGTDDGWLWCKDWWFDSMGAEPRVIPMVLNKRGRWNGSLMGV